MQTCTSKNCHKVSVSARNLLYSDNFHRVYSLHHILHCIGRICEHIGLHILCRTENTNCLQDYIYLHILLTQGDIGLHIVGFCKGNGLHRFDMSLSYSLALKIL